MHISDFDVVIFDNDGVLVNSEPLSCGALRRLIHEEFEVDIGDDFSDVIGTNDDHSLQFYAGQHDFEINDMEYLKKRKQEIYFDMAEGNLESFDGCEKFIQGLGENNYKLAVASSGSLDKIQFSLEQVGFTQYFDVICSAEEIQFGKPAPDLFLFTANMLNTEPQECLVLEDSTKGITGAKAAGMQVAGFTSSFEKETLIQHGPDIIFSDYHILQQRLFDKI